MKQNNFSQKRTIHMYIIIFIVILMFLIAGFIMIRYSVEGEKNLPFNLSKINIISTAQNDLSQDEQEVWHAKIVQKNNIYLVIEKNEKYKKNEAIKKISLENFETSTENENIIISLYRPSTSVKDYIYNEEYKIENSLELVGELSTNTEELQINNQGGIIGISTLTENIGEYTFAGDDKLPGDGRILNKANIQEEDIKFNLSFDLIIETSSGNKFKSRISLELPTGNISETGVGTLEKSDLKDIVFKRF